MPTTIVFVRHAQGYHNEDGKIRGDLAYNDPVNMDANLTIFGINQAMSNNLGTEKFNQIFCSPMRRCKQTLLNIYPKSQTEPVIVDDRLIEHPQGLHISDKRLEKNDPNSYTPLRWNTRLVSETNPFVVDVDRDVRSILNFTNFVRDKYPNGKILVVTHGRWLHNWFKIYRNENKWFNNCDIIRVVI
jgi:broad specificity phosphatase PhoE